MSTRMELTALVKLSLNGGTPPLLKPVYAIWVLPTTWMPPLMCQKLSIVPPENVYGCQYAPLAREGLRAGAEGQRRR
jgi:hypothetical protein